MSHTIRTVLVAGFSLLILGTTVAIHQAMAPTAPVAIPSRKPDRPLPGVADAKPRYWKGNLHTHSLWSDGDDFPEMIGDWYKQNGYHFLALTEHNVIAEGDRWISATQNPIREKAVADYRNRFGDAWVERRTNGGKAEVRLKPQSEYRSLLNEAGRFLIIPGEEITSRYAKSPVHINSINLQKLIPPLVGDSVLETVRVNLAAVADQRKQAGTPMIAFLNHPNFGWGVRAEELIRADMLRFFEVYNGHPGVQNYGDAEHPSCEEIWDQANFTRITEYGLPLVYGLATDDAHQYHQWGGTESNPGRGWVMVRAPHLTAEHIIAGLEAGDFYSTTGVLFDEIRRDGMTYRLKIQPQPGVHYKTEFIVARKTARDKAAISPKATANAAVLPPETGSKNRPVLSQVVATVDGLTPSYTLTGDELFVRARVTSSKRHINPFKAGDYEMAWTQPFHP
jgi:hypothetical protein